MRLRPRHIRAQLSLSYVALLAVILLLYAGATSTFLLWELRGQLFRYAIQDLETVEGLLSFDSHGRVLFKDDYHNHVESKLIQERYLEVLSADGDSVLFRNDRLTKQLLGRSRFAGEGKGGYFPREDRLPDGTHILLISREHSINGRPVLVRLAYSEEPLRVEYWQLLCAFMLCFPLVLGAAGFASHALARRLLRPLEEMTSRARRITPDDLDERLPMKDPENELGQLAQVFNLTLDRLAQSFDRLKNFTSDASHELRTPLASIRGVGEVSLQRDLAPNDYREAIGSMLEEAERLTTLVDSLLIISRADAGEMALQRLTLHILEPMRESAELLEVLVEEKSQCLKIEGEEGAIVKGDRLILRQAFVNFLHNAVKYSPVGGTISMRAGVAGTRVIVTIQDNGPGIAAEHAERVFDRFYRVDRSRSRDGGGAGLGLAIAKWAVEAHGGTVTVVTDSDPWVASGAVFRIELPLSIPFSPKSDHACDEESARIRH